MFASKDHKRFKRSQAPLLLHTKWSNSFWYFSSALAGEFVLSSYPLVIWRASWEKAVLLLFPSIGVHLSIYLNVNKFNLPPFPWWNLGRYLEALPDRSGIWNPTADPSAMTSGSAHCHVGHSGLMALPTPSAGNAKEKNKKQLCYQLTKAFLKWCACTKAVLSFIETFVYTRLSMNYQSSEEFFLGDWVQISFCSSSETWAVSNKESETRGQKLWSHEGTADITGRQHAAVRGLCFIRKGLFLCR